MPAVIINADDFGLSESVNRAITTAFSEGLINNTTMLTNGRAFDEAVKIANENGFEKKVGIHFNLTEGEPLTDNIKKCSVFCENGIYHGRINRTKPLGLAEKSAVYEELEAQAKKVRAAGFLICKDMARVMIHYLKYVKYCLKTSEFI